MEQPRAEDLFDFAWISDVDDRLGELMEKAEKEDWSYHHTDSEHPFPILYNYVRYMYRRLAEERKIALSEDGQFACFNTALVTALVTAHQEPLFASFETNCHQNAQPWFLKDWFRRG